MKRQILFISLLVVLHFIFAACSKNENKDTSSGGVELYLLESYKTTNSSYQIDEGTIVTKSQPLVTYSNFLFYDSSNHAFQISDAAKATLEDMDFSVHGMAFAIKANNVLIYTGYFWPSYSSASCSWVVIDPITLSSGNVLNVKLGYPGLINGEVIPDKRNDQRILDIFAKDNKLIK